MENITKSVAAENINQASTQAQRDLIERLGRQVVPFPFTWAKVMKWHFGDDTTKPMPRRGEASEMIDALKAEIASR